MERYTWPEGYNSAYTFTSDVDAESLHIWRSPETGIKGLNQLEQRRFGLREGIFNLLELLEQAGIRATCFVPGYEATTRPWLLETIAKYGHEIGLHCWYHEVVADISADKFREIMEKTISCVKSFTGQTPVGFRSPSWEMTGESLAILKEMGMKYDSSLSGYDHPYEINGITEIPIQWPLDDAIYFRYIGGGVDRWHPASTTVQCGDWTKYIYDICRYGGVAVSTVHPWITGRPGRIAVAEAMLEQVANAKGVWIATLAEIAEYHESSKNFGKYSEGVEIPSLPVGYW